MFKLFLRSATTLALKLAVLFDDFPNMCLLNLVFARQTYVDLDELLLPDLFATSALRHFKPTDR